MELGLLDFSTCINTSGSWISMRGGFGCVLICGLPLSRSCCSAYLVFNMLDALSCLQLDDL